MLLVCIIFAENKTSMMKRFTLGCLLACMALSASAEKTYKYRVNLKDKVGTA